MEYQRQIHLQRLAEQEAEMQARLDQQRRYAQQREQQNQVNTHIDQNSNLIFLQMPSYIPPPTLPTGYYQHPIQPSQLPPQPFSMGRK